MIRDLGAGDRETLRRFYDRAADYVMMQTGLPPDDETLDDFLHSAAPGCRAEDADRIGLFQDGILCGIAEQQYGYPEPGDAYVGLMLLVPDARGQGAGPRLLAELTARAVARRAPRQFIAVLDENSRGRAFWERHGFTLQQTFPPRLERTRWHVLHRMVRALPISPA